MLFAVRLPFFYLLGLFAYSLLNFKYFIAYCEKMIKFATTIMDTLLQDKDVTAS